MRRVRAAIRTTSAWASPLQQARLPFSQEGKMAEPTVPTDAELDQYILFRFAMLGIDISVLPYDDPAAQVTQLDVLEGCRDVIRGALTVLEFPLDPQYTIATYYASPQSAWTDPAKKSFFFGDK
jgi:hypothetical protein